MKEIVFIILTFTLWSNSFGQSKLKFKHTYFESDGEVSEVKENSIQVDTRLDLEFYRKNFSKPYYYPRQFADKRYLAQTIVVWNDTSRAKDFNSNWSFTYTYDSLSRITAYDYSGCLACSQIPYRVQITYDRQNRPATFQIRHSFDRKRVADEEYAFTYDDKGNIILIRFYRFGKLEEQIEKI